MEHFDTLDLDKLQALIVMCRDGGVAKCALGPLRLEFQAVEPEPQVQEHPTRPVIDSPKPEGPGGYVKLFGGELPKWPKAQS